MALAGALRSYDTAGLTQLNYGTDVFRIRDIEQVVPWKRNYGAEFYRFLANARTGMTLSQIKFEFGARRDKHPSGIKVKTAAASGATSLTVYDAYLVVPGMILVCDRTGEQMRVNSVTDANTIVVDSGTTGYGRGFAGTTAAALVIGDNLRFMPVAMEELGEAPDTRRVGPTPMRWNYPEFFAAAVSTSTIQENTQMIDGVGKMSEAQMLEMWAFEENINTAIWLGRRSLVETSKGPLYLMDGFDAQATVHSRDLSGITTLPWGQWVELFAPAFDAPRSSTSKDLYCGRNVYQSIVNSARATGIKPEHFETIWGTQVDAIMLDSGNVVNLIKDYNFFSGERAGDARLVDGAFVELRPFAGWEQKVIPDVQDNNQKGIVQKNMILEGGSFKVENPDCHMKLTGFGGPFKYKQIP